MRITAAQLNELKTPKGGFTRKTLELLGVGYPPKKGWKKRLLTKGYSSVDAAKAERKREAAKKKKLEKKERKKVRRLERVMAKGGDVNSKAFLESYEWRKLRMVILKKHGARCQCCGRSQLDGVTIHVDHIKPRRKYPELALDANNLQVLCHECNHGKGNWDETDWREPRLATLMGE